MRKTLIPFIATSLALFTIGCNNSGDPAPPADAPSPNAEPVDAAAIPEVPSIGPDGQPLDADPTPVQTDE